MAESQKVTHPNRISHYIMVAEVKKPKKLNDWKKKLRKPKAPYEHAAARLLKMSLDNMGKNMDSRAKDYPFWGWTDLCHRIFFKIPENWV